MIQVDGRGKDRILRRLDGFGFGSHELTKFWGELMENYNYPG
jgi:hypothetical protein